MPYLEEARKALVTRDPKRANKDGDFNLLFSLEFLKLFNENPSYATIALIRKAASQPHRVDAVGDLEDLLIVQGVPELDRRTARNLAFAEFYERVGKVYEQKAREKNGDLEEFEIALKLIDHKFRKTEAK